MTCFVGLPPLGIGYSVASCCMIFHSVTLLSWYWTNWFVCCPILWLCYPIWSTRRYIDKCRLCKSLFNSVNDWSHNLLRNKQLDAVVESVEHWPQMFNSQLSQISDLLNWYLLLPSQVLGIIRIVKGLVGSASGKCDWVGYQQTGLPLREHYMVVGHFSMIALKPSETDRAHLED